jgi:hypothetical protein
MKNLFVYLLLLSLCSIAAYSQTTKKIDYTKKIQEATPKPLPQSPIAQKLKSDAEDLRLKGKIKSLIEEREGLTGIEKPIGRKLSLIAEFNEQGNYLKEINFEYRGKPTNVTVYGYIDNQRASFSNSVSFGDELRGIIVGEQAKEETKITPDPRFDYKYEYKYVDGKLAEMQMIRNTGSKGMRYVYNHKGNQMEELAYTDEGELNQRYIYIFDEKGNEIEQISFNVFESKIPENGRYSLKYEAFDKMGNWTKRISSEVEVKNGKKVYKPDAIEYRTITYYP